MHWDLAPPAATALAVLRGVNLELLIILGTLGGCTSTRERVVRRKEVVLPANSSVLTDWLSATSCTATNQVLAAQHLSTRSGLSE